MKREGESEHWGLDDLLKRSLLFALWERRTHRVSRGTSVKAGSMSYSSSQEPQPLSELEEALLIAVTGCTGLTMPDRPFQDPQTGAVIMAKPNLTMSGRTAGSPDNAQGTHFFLINDTGTYFLRNLPPPETQAPFAPAELLERASRAKVRVLDRRLDVPTGQERDFPAYLDSNRFLSNLPGTTVLLPIVDLSHQYINGLMYLLTQPEGARPTLVDDRNFYRPAGVKRWVKSGFLNEDLKIPLGLVGSLRTQIEADLLLQNLMLVADSMGLGAWIHATIGPPVMMGDPKFVDRYGKMLGFDHITPRWRFLDLLRWQIPLPKYANLRAQPVGLKIGDEYLIQAKCPPYYKTMSDAVDAVVDEKFGAEGLYKNRELFSRIYKEGFGDTYLSEAAEYSSDVIECVRDICTYIYETHGRFPAHCDAIHVPGVWLQVHHVDLEYYERFFQKGVTDLHKSHHQKWHATDSPELEL
jgi:hypothetical protein